MARLQALVAALAAVLCAAPCWAAEEVEVVVESAPVKVRDAVVATVRRGERYRVVQRQGSWTAIALGGGNRRVEGWVLSDKLRAIVDPSITDETAAPGAPSPVYAAAELVQMTSHSQAQFLFFRLSLKNASDEAAELAIADLVLRIGDKRLPYTRPRTAPFPISVALLPGEYPRTRADSLLYFEDCVLRPNDAVTRWLSFDLGELRSSPGQWLSLAEKRWILEGKLGEHPFTLDLTESEARALSAKLRPANIEPSVSVIEFRSEINLLNLTSLTAIAEQVPLGDPGFVLLPAEPSCYFDYEAAQRWRSWQVSRRRDKAPSIVVQTPGVNATWRSRMFPSAPSEAAAALAVLGRRDGAGATLLRHLHDEQLTTRIGAAESLGTHLDEPGVLRALVALMQDRPPDLRAAALRALGDRKAKAPADARQDDSADTAALVAAMDESEAAIRNAAAYAAGAFDCPRARTALAAMLDDSDKAVQLAACASLGELKAKEGVEKLQALRTSAELQLKTAALDALKSIGELSEIDAVLEKFKGSAESSADFQALAKSKDPRALRALIAALKGRQRTLAAYALADLGDRQAVEPLIEALERNRGKDRIPFVIALGKLGDPWAIDPIREALATSDDDLYQRLQYVKALLELQAPAAVDEAAALSKNLRSAGEKQQLLSALGRHGGEQVMPLIEPFLDDPQACRFAARALATLNAPMAVPALEKRLLSADYAHGPKVLQELSQVPRWLEDNYQLLKKAGESPNAATQSAARKLRAGKALQVDD
ncbi:MAG TPA: HEAT repeat domain-containing protein [Pirellulales bacterium]|nr:HEAT repeat domain-containing protein [Pirellulales bacterium]